MAKVYHPDVSSDEFARENFDKEFYYDYYEYYSGLFLSNTLYFSLTDYS